MSSDAVQLIRELVQFHRHATESEVKQIISHVAQQPLSRRLIKINRWLRQELFQRNVEIALERLPSAELHLMKRIHFDQQWSLTTTVAMFEADLHMAVQHPAVQVWTYRRLSEPCAGFLAPSHVQDAPKSEAFIFVAYSAEFGTIKTGFQASSAEAVFSDLFEHFVQHR